MGIWMCCITGRRCELGFQEYDSSVPSHSPKIKPKRRTETRTVHRPLEKPTFHADQSLLSLDWASMNYQLLEVDEANTVLFFCSQIHPVTKSDRGADWAICTLMSFCVSIWWTSFIKNSKKSSLSLHLYGLTVYLHSIAFKVFELLACLATKARHWMQMSFYKVAWVGEFTPAMRFCRLVPSWPWLTRAK